MATLSPYLNFENKCREAMTFYQAAFGGKLELQKVSDMPEMAAKMPPEFSDAILHSALTSGGISIYASDLNRDKQVEGNTVRICINCESEEELDHLFDKLSAGGEVVHPIGDMPWGAKYAELNDKFGKMWILNFQRK